MLNSEKNNDSILGNNPRFTGLADFDIAYSPRILLSLCGGGFHFVLHGSMAYKIAWIFFLSAHGLF